MLYERYQKKIKIIAHVISAFVKTLPIILISIAALSVLVITLVAAKGSVGSVNCPDELPYGEAIECNAFGLLSDVEFEYCVAGSNEWTREVPREVGEYWVRAVGKTSFGGNRYSQPKTISIKPTPLDVSVLDSEVVYGELPKVTAALRTGETIVCDAFTYGDVAAASTVITPNVNDGHTKIFDENGKDITFCYSLSAATTDISVLPRAVGITVEDYTAVYEGKDIVFNKYQITEGSLVAGDSEQATFSHKQLEVGSTENKPTFRAFNSAGIEVTHLYSFDVHQGKITVDVRPLVVETATYEETYKGSGISCTDFEVIESTSLAENHWIEVSEYTSVVNYKEGGYANTMLLRIRDAEGNDVTSNYSLTVIEGTITVNKRPVTVTSATVSQVYNGQALIDSTSVSDNLVENHTVTLSVSEDRAIPSITDVGETLNDFNVISITDASGADVTDNYLITPVYGTLSVTKRPITIMPEYVEKIYDSTPLLPGAIVVSSESANPLVEGHSVTGDITGARVLVGAAPSEIIEETVKIMSGETDVTANYYIQCKAGVIDINKREVKIRPISQSFTYDGNSHRCTEYEVVEGYLDIAEGDRLIVDESASVVNVSEGQIPNTFNTAKCRIVNKNDETDDRAANYFFSISNEECGNLTVIPRNLTVLAQSVTDAVYDGKNQYFKGCTVTNDPTAVDEGLAIGEFIQVVDSTVFNKVMFDGEGNVVAGENEIFSVRIYKIAEDGSETDVELSNYEITSRKGSVLINKRPITVSTGTAEWTYNGHKNYCVDGEGNLIVSVNGCAEGHGFSVAEKTCVSDFSDIPDNAVVSSDGNRFAIPNAVTVTIWCGEEDVTQNYEVAEENFGTLTLKKRRITVKAEGETIEYDGLVHKFTDHTVTVDPTAVDEGLVDGHKFEVLDSTSFKNVMIEGDNVISGKNAITAFKIYDETDSAMTDLSCNYDVELLENDVTITKKPITVTTLDHQWTYDGKVHSSDTEKVNGKHTLVNVEGLVLDEAHGIAHVYQIASCSFVKDFKNVAPDEDRVTEANTVLIEVYDGEEPVTANYEISYSCQGTLTLIKRYIKVQAEGATAEYNGLVQKFLTPTVLDCRDGLAENHKFKVTESTAFKNVMFDGEGNEISGKNEITDFEIYDVNDSEMTDLSYNYVVELEKNDVTIIRKPFKLSTGSRSWVYDGKVHHWKDSDEFGDPTVKVEGLVSGHWFDVVENSWATVKDFPIDHAEDLLTKPNTLEVKICSDEGDVTRNYKLVEEDYGTLTLEKRPYVIITGDQKWTYDGEIHHWKDNDEFGEPTVKVEKGDATLAEGHWFDVVENSWATVKDFPIDHAEDLLEKSNTLEIRIYSDEGDVTHNYKLIEEDYGTLTLEKRRIKVEAESKTVVYNGSEQYFDGFDVLNYRDGLAEHHIFKVLESTAFKNATLDGEGNEISEKNKITSFKIYNANDPEMTDLSHNYVVELADGDVTVERKPVTLYTFNKDLIYDGKEQWWTDDVKFGENDLVVGHTFEIVDKTTVSDFINNVPDNAVFSAEGDRFTVTNEVTVEIMDENNVDVTVNYNIAPVFGELTLIKRHIIIYTEANESVVYDAEKHTFKNYTVGGDGFAPNQSLKVKESTTLINVSDPVENVFEECIIYLAGNETEDLSDNYVISFVYGQIKLQPRPITIETDGDEKMYDGKELVANTDEDWKIVAGDTVGTHTLSVTITGKQDPAPGESENTFEWVITDANGNNMSSNYEVTPIKGVLNITKVPVKLLLKRKTITYNAVEQNVSLSSGGQISGVVVSNINFNMGITNAGYILVSDVEAKIYTDDLSLTVTRTLDNGDVISVPKDYCEITIQVRGNADDYEVNYAVHVKQRKIRITVKNVEKDDDGTPLPTPQCLITYPNGLVSGQAIDEGSIQIELYDTAYGEGETIYYYHVVRDSVKVTVNGVDATRNYDIELISGTHTIRDREAQ